MLALLGATQVLMHPFVVGELAVDSLADRAVRLADLDDLPPALRASDFVVRSMIEAHKLFGTGLSYVDLHLLASTRVTPLARLWTRDRRLAAAATRLDVALTPPSPPPVPPARCARASPSAC